MTAARVDVKTLCAHLGRALQHGARAGCLLLYTPDIIDLLYPADVYPDLSIDDRASLVENLIRAAVDSIGGDAARALAVILCLSPGSMLPTLSARRRRAGEHVGVEARTFRSDRHEGRLLFYLASEIYRAHIAPKA